MRILSALFLTAWTLTPSVTLADTAVIELEQLKFKPKRIWSYTNPYMPEFSTPGRDEVRPTRNHPEGTTSFEHWLYGVGVDFDLNLLRYKEQRLFFWDNSVYTYGTTAQVRHVGWEWNLGIELVPGRVRLYHHHHSEHVMEREQGAHYNRYPLLDEFVLELTFYDRKRKN